MEKTHQRLYNNNTLKINEEENMSILIISFVFLVAIAGYILTTYNVFQKNKVRIKASVQEIGNQLKRQADLIPNLIESTKGYMKHENKIFQELTEARKAVMGAINSGNTKKMVEAQELVQKAIQPIRVVLESNPEIKASGVVNKLMDELRDTADKIMYARRTLIDLTADYNTKLVTMPSALVGKIFGFKKEEGLKTAESGHHLEVNEKEMETPKVSL